MQCNHKGPKGKRGRQGSQVERTCGDRNRSWGAMAFRSQKMQPIDATLEPPEGTQPADTDKSPVNAFRTSELQISKIIHLRGCEPLNL